jgi:TRAP transporter TAXI family solute receptor
MKHRIGMILLGVFILAMGLTVPGTVHAAKKKLTIGTASMGGAFYPVGTGIASLINKYVPGVDVRVEVTGGAVENPRLVGGGETDLGITNTSTAFFAVKGMKPYPKKLPIRAICLMYPSTFHMISRKNSGIQRLPDLKGKRVAVGPAGGGTISLLQRLLTIYNMTIKDFKPSYISYNDGSLALQDGNVDATILLAGAPTSAVKELTVRTPIQFLKMKEEEVRQFLDKYPYYMQVIIPKSYYGTDADVLTVGVGNLLIVNEKMDADLVYKITAALYNHVEEFKKVHPATKVVSLESAPNTVIPLHPGAQRYFKEKGLIR